MSDPKRPAHPLAPARTARRVDALFKAMSTDFLLREQFVTEPTQLLAEYVHGRKVDADHAAVADQLFYAILASDDLMSWLRDYAQKNGGRRPGREDLVRDFSRAVAETGARHVVIALARASAERQNVFETEIDVLSLIFDALVDVGPRTVTEMSTGHTTGTEMSTGHVFVTEMSTGHTTGTEMSTGHVFATEMSTGHTTGTEMSTGHVFATEMSTGHTTGTEMSTGHVFATEMSTGTGTEMSTGHTTGTEMSTGHIVDRGSVFATEMSTGTGTEMSTGHTTGTEMSTGHLVGREVFASGLHRATFAALVEYARNLRDTGALDVVFGQAAGPR